MLSDPGRFGCALQHQPVVGILSGCAGNQLNTQNQKGRTPLHIAAKYGNEDAFRALLAIGALTDVQDVKDKYGRVAAQLDDAPYWLSWPAPADTDAPAAQTPCTNQRWTYGKIGELLEHHTLRQLNVLLTSQAAVEATVAELGAHQAQCEVRTFAFSGHTAEGQLRCSLNPLRELPSAGWRDKSSGSQLQRVLKGLQEFCSQLLVVIGWAVVEVSSSAQLVLAPGECAVLMQCLVRLIGGFCETEGSGAATIAILGTQLREAACGFNSAQLRNVVSAVADGLDECAGDPLMEPTNCDIRDAAARCNSSSVFCVDEWTIGRGITNKRVKVNLFVLDGLDSMQAARVCHTLFVTVGRAQSRGSNEHLLPRAGVLIHGDLCHDSSVQGAAAALACLKNVVVNCM